MTIRVQRHANLSKQATLLDGVDVGPLNWRVCECGLNRFVHEGMNCISNVKVHLSFVRFQKLSFFNLLLYVFSTIFHTGLHVTYSSLVAYNLTLTNKAYHANERTQ